MPLEDSDELIAFLRDAERNGIPKIKDSRIFLSICPSSDPQHFDAKMALEIGAAILLNKPIIVITDKRHPLPLALRKVADKIVEVDDAMSEEAKTNVMKALAEMVKEN